MGQKDYYEILGIRNDADSKQVRDAYRKLALLYHPDRNRNHPDAAERMKEINEAYAVISDPQKRKEYDLLKTTYGASAYGRFRQTHTEQDIFKDSDIRQVFEELSRAFGFRGFEDVFREAYGAGFQTFEFRKQGVFGRFFVGAIIGGQAGSGKTASAGYLERIVRFTLKRKWGIEWPEHGRDINGSLTLSADQASRGGKIPYTCKKTGRTFVVTIPPKTQAGRILRLKGMGEPGRAGGVSGDLYVRVDIASSLTQKAREILGAIKASLSS